MYKKDRKQMMEQLFGKRNRAAVRRGAAAGLSLLLAASVLSGCSTVQAATLAASGSSGREETVYVVAGADGTAKEEISSVWLKNPEGRETLTDGTELRDVENVKGEETYTEDDSGNMIWQADGKDIYYQGYTEKELPVTTEITYMLDGQPIQPEDLAGKSGHLKITLTYTNHEKREARVQGKAVTLYEPFLAVSALPMENDKVSNVTVSSGKLINTGDKTIVVGYALPGMQESLSGSLNGRLQETDGEKNTLPELPGSLTVEADVTDFSLLTTLTLIDNSLLQDLDLDDVHTLEDLKEAVDALGDASGQLKDGSTQLADGIQELADKAPELCSGITQLDQGAEALASGANTLASGAVQVSSGTAQAASGAAQLYRGAEEAAKGADALYEGSGALEDGAAQLSGGLQQLAAQTSGLPEGSRQLYEGARQVREALQGEQGQSIYEGLVQLQNGVAQLGAGLKSGDPKNPGICEAAQGIRSGAGEIRSGAQAVDAASEQIAGAAEGLSAASATIDKGTQDLQQLVNAASALLGSVQGKAPEALYSEAAAAIQEAQGDLTMIGQGVQELNATTGALQTTAGSLAAGNAQLSTGAGALAKGMQALTAGTQALAAGGTTLAAGAQTLHDGTGQLREGSIALDSGVQELLDGALQLRDGMAEFDEEGIEALTAFVEEDAEGLIERLRVIRELGNAYTSFTGKETHADDRVQFIMRTESIGLSM